MKIDCVKDISNNKVYSLEVPYSTEEVRIGTDYDGKSIYKKTFLGTTGNSNTTIVTTGIAKIKKYYGFMVKIDGGTTYNFPLSTTFGSSNEQITRIVLNASNSNVMLQNQSYFYSCDYEVTIEYTKTTD